MERLLSAQMLEWMAWAITVVGIAVVVWGALVGLFEVLRLEIDLLRGRGVARDRAIIRQDLGHHILLGLEFMIAADVIATAIEPTLERLGVLAGLVGIRTFISHFLISEMDRAGRLDDPSQDAHAQDAGRSGE